MGYFLIAYLPFIIIIYEKKIEYLTAENFDEKFFFSFRLMMLKTQKWKEKKNLMSKKNENKNLHPLSIHYFLIQFSMNIFWVIAAFLPLRNLVQNLSWTISS